MASASVSDLRKLQLENFNLQWELQKIKLAKKFLSQQMQELQDKDKLKSDEAEKKYSTVITEQREEIQRMRTVSVDVCKRHDAMQVELNRSNARLQQLDSENLQLKLDLESERDLLRVQNETITSLQLDLEIVSGNLEKSKSVTLEKEREIQEFQKIISVKSEVENESKKKIELSDKQLNKNGSIIHEQNNCIAELEHKVGNLSAEKEKLMETHKNEKNALETTIAEKERKIKGLLEQVKSLEKSHACQQTFFDKHEKYIKDLESQVEILGPALEENRTLQRKSDEDAGHISRLEVELQELNWIIRDNQKVREDQEKKYNNEIKGLEEKIGKLQERSAELEVEREGKGKLQEMIAEVEGEREKIVKLQERIAELEGEREEIGKLQERITEVEGEREKVVKFVEGVKTCSEFKENDRPLMSQLEDLETHVRNRFGGLKKFCDLMEKTLNGHTPTNSSAPKPNMPLQPSKSNQIETQPLSSNHQKNTSESETPKGLRQVSKTITKKRVLNSGPISQRSSEAMKTRSSSSSRISIAATFTPLVSPSTITKETATDEIIDDVEFIDLT